MSLIPLLRKRRARIVGLSTFVMTVFAATTSEAHFELQEPPAALSQDSVGSPQKMGPCGDEGGGTSTGIVTAFQSGQTITVTIKELVFHPGHYRIALAEDRADLPVEPIVTAAATPCGSVPIDMAPAFPVFADGVFKHTQPFTSPQSISITLPSNITCTHCTLQVIEFMSDHDLNVPGGCFYHHCADVSIGVESDAGESVSENSEASGCSASGSMRANALGGLVVLFGANLLLRLRHRRLRR